MRSAFSVWRVFHRDSGRRLFQGIWPYKAFRVSFLPSDCVMAVGDHTNDIEVIKKAGIGVAVANADPQLKAVADYITIGERDQG